MAVQCVGTSSISIFACRRRRARRACRACRGHHLWRLVSVAGHKIRLQNRKIPVPWHCSRTTPQETSRGSSWQETWLWDWKNECQNEKARERTRKWERSKVSTVYGEGTNRIQRYTDVIATERPDFRRQVLRSAWGQTESKIRFGSGPGWPKLSDGSAAFFDSIFDLEPGHRPKPSNRTEIRFAKPL